MRKENVHNVLLSRNNPNMNYLQRTIRPILKKKRNSEKYAK